MTFAMFVFHSALIYGAYYMLATWDSYGML